MRIRLPSGGGVRIEGDARGMVVGCTEGIIWLTQPCDVVDHFIAAGESFTVTRKGVVMVEARREACLTLTEPLTAEPCRIHGGTQILTFGGGM